jgi:trehalose 6-phosphate phosphatase
MSRPLFAHLDEVEQQLTTAPALLLCCDLEGTLTPLQEEPEKGELAAPVRQLLQQLAQRDNLTLAIISGRSLEDLRHRVGVPNLIYASNHGLEISGPELSFVESSAVASRETLQQLITSLSSRLQTIAGVRVEDKGLTASVHYRQAAAEEWDEVRRQVHGVLASASHPFMLATGHLVYEIRPRVYWNKGAAFNWIVENLGTAGGLPIYLGDDATDEDVFVLLPEAITIKVGSGAETAARYRVNSPAEVRDFLAWLAHLPCPETPPCGVVY